MTCQESNKTKTGKDEAECSNYWSTSSSTMKVNDQVTQGYKKVVFAGERNTINPQISLVVQLHLSLSLILGW